MKNSNLTKAKKAKNDEFYTQLVNIEDELIHYRQHFKDKIIYCNCDTDKSNFVKYFRDNKDTLSIKKLYYTGMPDIDFRSDESIELLKKADIVVTNPPFSLFREYIAQLIKYDKKFLIIGSINAVIYKEIFPYIKDNKLWLGNTSPKKFVQPDGTIKNFGNILWFTNLEHNKRNDKLHLVCKYNPIDYPKYDNYDAINVDKVAEIPGDYDGIMGVPITFLNNYSPEQFEIIGSNRGIKQDKNGYYGRSSYISGKETFKRIFIKRKK